MTILGLAAVAVIILVCLVWPAADSPKTADAGQPNRAGPDPGLTTMDLPDSGSRGLLGKLARSMPELPAHALRKAYSLAQHGASTDDLVRILNLTRQQAVTIVTNARERR